jgi:aminopeptidase N
MKNAAAKTIYLRDYAKPEFLIDKVDLQFLLDEAYTLVTAQLQIAKNPNSASEPKDLVLSGDSLELVSIMLNEKTLTKDEFTVDATKLTVFNVPKQFSLQITTRIHPAENTALSGLYKSSGNFCTQCEPHGFSRIMYYIDRPDVMARFTTEIIADKKKYPILLSNGNLVESKDVQDGKHYVKWEDPFKKPCYLFALVAGDFEFIEDTFQTMSGRNILLRIYVEKGNVDQCMHAMQALKKAMRWDEENYGREYDLDIYMIVAVSDFNMGAMENKGLNIFNTQYILAKPTTATDYDYIHVESVIAHEYFHNWTGNRITCRDWFQLSLKEGLTVFRDQSFTADTTSKTMARIDDVDHLRNYQFAEDAGPLAHPVRPNSYEEINNFYTSTVYNKGAELIRMQRTILGKELFRKGMDLYFKRHDGQAVTIEDFVAAMEDASGISLQQFRLWYSETGTPVLDVEDRYDAKTKVYTLRIKQNFVKNPLHIPIQVGLLDKSGQELHHELLQMTDVNQEFHFKNMNEKPTPSLLRNFSAPAKVNFAYSDADLQLLFKHDHDLFNRRDAGQRYALKVMLALIADFQQKKPLKLSPDFFATFTHLVENMHEDKLMMAECLNLPSEKYIGEQMEIIDVDAIHHVREFVIHALAQKLQHHFIAIYEKNHDLKNPYVFTLDSVGKRRLANICLFYLGRLNSPDIQQNIILPQFKNAIDNNMTDTMAALRALADSTLPGYEEALVLFYQKFQHEALVVDKWLSIQATSQLDGTIQKVQALTKHPAFDIKNPNKVYALINAFCFRNLLHFHDASGAGYEFIKNIVLEIDALNPQVAARVVKAFSDWKRFDEGRKHLMRQELQHILQHKNISKDVYEIVSKSLYL